MIDLVNQISRKITDQNSYRINHDRIFEAINPIVEQIVTEEGMHQPHIGGLSSQFLQTPDYPPGLPNNNKPTDKQDQINYVYSINRTHGPESQ